MRNLPILIRIPSSSYPRKTFQIPKKFLQEILERKKKTQASAIKQPNIKMADTSPPSQETQNEWLQKLGGKKLVERNDSGDSNCFCTADLPQGPQAHRVIPPGSVVTRDFVPGRMNVHVDEDGKVTHINYQ